MGTSGCSIRINIFSGAAVIRLRRSHGGRAAGGYRCVRKQAKASLEQATRATSFRGVAGNFRAALWAKSDCAAPPLLLRKILPEVTPEPQQLNGAAHLRYRWALQPCGRSLLATRFGNAGEIDKRPA